MKYFFMVIFVTIFGLIGCGKPPGPNENNESSFPENESFGKVDPSFTLYLNRVKNTLIRLGISRASLQKIDYVSINYEAINGKAVGVCNTEIIKESNGKIIYSSKKIFMDPYKWSNLNEEGKKEILAHELGHCAWGLDHLNYNYQIMSEVVSNINENAWIYFSNQIKNVRN